MYNEHRTWNQAKDKCEEEFGTLATVCNDETNDMLIEMMQTQGRRGNLFLSHDQFLGY